MRDYDAIPVEVRAAYGFSDADFTPITVGLINQTYRVDTGRGRFVLQRLHPVFEPTVNLDLEAVSEHLAAKGMPTPRLVRTRDGGAWVSCDGHWRVLTWLEGRVFVEVGSPRIAYEAGALAGRFHAATSDLKREFAFTRAGVHDTPRHLARLEAVLAASGSHEMRALLEPLATSILAHARALPPLPETRSRIVHGDLKITNLLFEPQADRGLALLDLDTLANGTLPVELGDALRSWCNPAGESDPRARCDAEIVEAALIGYAEASPTPLDADAFSAVPLGLETIAIELASRFATDAYEDRYFGWDPKRFPSRAEHNRIRAESQLALARSVGAQRADLEALVRRLLP